MGVFAGILFRNYKYQNKLDAENIAEYSVRLLLVFGLILTVCSAGLNTIALYQMYSMRVDMPSFEQVGFFARLWEIVTFRNVFSSANGASRVFWSYLGVRLPFQSIIVAINYGIMLALYPVIRVMKLKM